MKALVAGFFVFASITAQAGTLSTEFASDGAGPDTRPCVFWVETMTNGNARWVGVDQTTPAGPAMASRLGVWAAERRSVWINLYTGGCGNITVGQACGDTAGNSICAPQ